MRYIFIICSESLRKRKKWNDSLCLQMRIFWAHFLEKLEIIIFWKRPFTNQFILHFSHYLKILHLRCPFWHGNCLLVLALQVWGKGRNEMILSLQWNPFVHYHYSSSFCHFYYLKWLTFSQIQTLITRQVVLLIARKVALNPGMIIVYRWKKGPRSTRYLNFLMNKSPNANKSKTEKSVLQNNFEFTELPNKTKH